MILDKVMFALYVVAIYIMYQATQYLNIHLRRIEMSMKAKQPKIKYYSTSEIGNMSKKVRIMAARAIMES